MMNPMIILGRSDISPIKRILTWQAINGSNLNEYTETGNPVSFETNVAKPMSVQASFSPVQTGSGDPSPENVRSISGFSSANLWRTGKNLLDPDAITSNESQIFIYWANGIVLSAGTYTLTAEETMSQIAVRDFETNTNIASAYNQSALTFTISATTKIKAFVYKTGIDRTQDIQLEVGTPASAYEEYTGQSVSVTFPALGKNLFDKNAVASGKIWYNGALIRETNNCASDYIPVIPGEVYTINRTTVGQNAICYFDDEKTFLSQEVVGSGGKQKTIPAGAYFVTFNVGNDYLDTAMFEKGSTASTYEPYNATAYGGTLDLTTGVLTVEWAGISKKWSEWTNATDMGNGITRKQLPMVNNLQTGATKNMCNIAPYASNEEAWIHFYYTGGGNCRIFLPSDTDGDTEITVITNLSVPLVYQLTPTEILSLIGNNVLWSDLNGNVTATYKKKG